MTNTLQNGTCSNPAKPLWPPKPRTKGHADGTSTRPFCSIPNGPSIQFLSNGHDFVYNTTLLLHRMNSPLSMGLAYAYAIHGSLVNEIYEPRESPSLDPSIPCHRLSNTFTNNKGCAGSPAGTAVCDLETPPYPPCLRFYPAPRVNPSYIELHFGI